MTIRKLPPSIINRISAGEVVTRPLSVVKELLENSIDAGATIIRVTYGENIVVVDNGSGIAEEDFELLCARYCTSKLRDERKDRFDILEDVCTYGFRGEALASISDVSTVVVHTKTKIGAYGHVLVYERGVLISKKREGMNDGTVVTVNDLFGSNAMRKRFFRNRKSEVVDIFRLVVGYQVINETKKLYFNVNGKDLVFPGALRGDARNELLGRPSSHTDESIRLPNEGPTLMHVQSFNASGCDSAFDNERINLKMAILNKYFNTENNLSCKTDSNILVIHSSPVHHQKDLILMLSINNRLVKSQSLKSKLYSLYKPFLPNRSFPLIYVEMRVENCDVNVDAMKQRVLFVGEDEVFEQVCRMIEEGLVHGSVGVCKVSSAKNEIKVYEGLKVENLASFEFRSSKHEQIGNGKMMKNKDILAVQVEETWQKNADDEQLSFKAASRDESVGKSGSEEMMNGHHRDNLGSNVLNDVKTENYRKNTANRFIKDMKYVGKLDNEKIFVQLNAFLMQCDYKKLLRIYFLQHMARQKGRFKTVVVKNNTFVASDSLKEYGVENVSDGVRVPVINNIVMDIAHLEKSDADKYSIADCFVCAVRDYEMFFGVIKRAINEDDDVLSCFSVVTGLNELYKAFKRI